MSPAPALVGLAAALFATGAGAAFARRRGWGDAPSGADAARKLQPRPVPPVGGPAILVGLLAARAAGAVPWAPAAPGAGPQLLERAGEPGAWAALLVAFATGLVDDLRPGGLRPAVKLAGQALAGVALAAPGLAALPLGEALGLAAAGALAAAFATNVWNTFDNADGAAGGLAALGLAAVGAPAAGPALGFLPWNLARGAPDERGRRAPFAYLGDSGSHLVGLLVLLSPAAWPLLLLPAADLARVSLERLRAGQTPWRGDRRHLAHRLERRGLGRIAVLGALCAAGAAPLVVPGAWGLVLGLALFAALVASTRP